MEQIERQLMILSFLSWKKNGYTIEELERKLNNVGVDVSRRTIQRDIDYLSEVLHITEEEISGKTHYMADKFKIADVSFTVQEMLSFCLIKQLIKPLANDAVGKNANIIIDKILSNIPKVYKGFLEDASKTLKVDWISPYLTNIDDDIFQMIVEAISECRSITMKYHSYSNDEDTVRKVNAYFIDFKDGTYYLYGYCYMRESLRVFKISRIIEVEYTPEKFTRPSQSEMEKIKQRRFENLIGEKRHLVRIKFTGEKARFLKEYDAYRADRLIDLGGDVIFERSVYELEDVKKWVLSYGSGVEVLEPIELREMIVQEIREILKNYK